MCSLDKNVFDYGRPRTVRVDTLPAEIGVHITKNPQQTYLNISASSCSPMSLLPVGIAPPSMHCQRPTNIQFRRS